MDIITYRSELARLIEKSNENAVIGKIQEDIFLSDSNSLIVDNFAEKIRLIENNELSIWLLASVDPATIAAVANQIMTIIKFFSEEPEDPMVKLLESIQGQIQYTIGLLNSIISMLEEIKVLIERQYAQQVIETLSAILEVISDNYEGWKTNIERDNVITEVTIVYARIQEQVRIARYHGYAYTDAIGMSFICEFALAELLNKDRQSKINSLNRYIEYFSNSLSVEIPFSIGHVFSATLQSMAALDSSFTPRKLSVGERITEIRDGLCLTKKWFDIQLDITGDVKNGFNFSEADALVRSQTYCRDPDGPRGPRISNNFFDEPTSEIVTRYSGDAIKRDFNQASHQYREVLLPQSLTLQAAKFGIEDYLRGINLYKSRLEGVS